MIYLTERIAKQAADAVKCPIETCQIAFAFDPTATVDFQAVMLIEIVGHLTEHINEGTGTRWQLVQEEVFKVYERQGTQQAIKILEKSRTLPEAKHKLEGLLGVREVQTILKEADPEMAIVMDAPLELNPETGRMDTIDPENVKITYDENVEPRKTIPKSRNLKVTVAK